ncbi:MAG: hypothetical protein ABIB61_01315 [Candidatus Shapirobacteria bacterium]
MIQSRRKWFGSVGSVFALVMVSFILLSIDWPVWAQEPSSLPAASGLNAGAFCGTARLHELADWVSRNVPCPDPTLAELSAAGKVDAAGRVITEQVGEQRPFWVLTSSNGTYTQMQITATLQVTGTHAYLYVENGQAVSEEALDALASAFDKDYEKVVATFGGEWKPGRDGDERLTILLQQNHDVTNPNWLGVFFMVDEYPDPVDAGRWGELRSNEREMFYINLSQVDGIGLASEDFKSVLVHEFQHMIHFNQDLDPPHDHFLWESI